MGNAVHDKTRLLRRGPPSSSLPTFCDPTFDVLPPFLQVFLEAERVAVEPEVFALVSVADLEVSEPEVFALVSVAAGLSPEVVSVADLEVSEPRVSEPEVFELRVSEPEVVSVADVAEPQVSADIAVAFDGLVPVSVVAIEVDSPGRPRFPAFPNVDHYASSSSSVEAVGQESAHSSTGARSNYGLCSILSNPGLHQNKNLEHYYNNPSPGYNNVSDTSDLPIGATTSHSRKTGLHLYRERRKHRSCQASLPHPEAPEMRWVAAEGC